MRAVTVSDGDLHWRDHPDPQPGARELLVAVKAAGLNGADMIQRRGLYAAPPDSPADIPGLELAGEVVAVGPAVEHFAIGDRVMAVVGGGGQAELALVHERTALRVPDGISWPEAGGFPDNRSSWAVCGLLTTAAALTVARAGLLPRAAGRDALPVRVGTQVAAAVLLARGAGGAALSGLDLSPTTPEFRRWNLRLYSPVCLVLGASIATVSRRATAPA